MNFIKKLLILSLLVSTYLQASDSLYGQKTISLIDKAGNRIVIGGVTFHRQGDDSSTYELHIDHAKFKDYFLSMKEMKCLEGPELWCHLPYPYPQPHRITNSDLRWLEHDLLFMFKTKKEFGANFWNGIYYDMVLKEGIITGKAVAVDLNYLASPHDDLNTPPISEAELDDIDEASRWLPFIEIH